MSLFLCSLSWEHLQNSLLGWRTVRPPRKESVTGAGAAFQHNHINPSECDQYLSDIWVVTAPPTEIQPSHTWPSVGIAIPKVSLCTADYSQQCPRFFLSFPFHLFSPHSHFYLNLTSQRSLYLPLSQILVNHVIGSSSESALNQCSSRVFLELPFLTCHKTKAPITQSH